VVKLIADEVENKSMFSLHHVAEEFATWNNDAEVGIVPSSHWKVGNLSTITTLISASL